MITNKLIKFSLALALLFTPANVLHAKADEYDFFNDGSLMTIYDDELSVAIMDGSGTVDDPYIVDYSQASCFEEYVLETWERSNQPGDASPNVYPNGYTGLCLTQYKGQYASGGVWTYSSGGPSVDSNGSLRFSKIAYVSGSHLQSLYILRQNNLAWLSVVNDIAGYAYGNRSAMIHSVMAILSNHGYATIAGMSLASIGAGVASAAGAAYAISGTLTLLYNASSSAIANSYNNGLNLVTISYLSSYNGSRYANSVSETGWRSNMVYVPGSFYGAGYFTAY